MSLTRIPAPRALLSSRGCTHLTRTLSTSLPLTNTTTISTLHLRSRSLPPFSALSQQLTHRSFSTTPRPNLEFFPPPREAPSIRTTPAAWPHPAYSSTAMAQIAVSRREIRTWSDWVAFNAVRVLRWGTDLATGYRHEAEIKKLEKNPGAERYKMTEKRWLIRIIFLESVAGVPGMVGGMLRHLRSLRRLERDNGWIESLLEEAYNERMHLLTFLKLAEPGPFMKLMVLGAQGVFCNAFFFAYLFSPRTCHRFVGYLEEEAVMTYTHCIRDLEAGTLPAWESLPAPDIAVRYWDMPEGKRGMKELLYYVRADEAKHREVNHTLGNLEQGDPNPYLSEYKDPERKRPDKGIETYRPSGWEREDCL